MSNPEVFLVGDLLRARKILPHENKTLLRDLHGSYFLNRSPVLLLHRKTAHRQDSPFGIIAYKQKNGVWKEDKWPVRLNNFELVARPAASKILNPYHTYKGVIQPRSISIYMNKYCYFITGRLAAPAFDDPDVEWPILPKPCLESQLGSAARKVLMEVHDYECLWDGKSYPHAFIVKMNERHKLAHDLLKTRLSEAFGPKVNKASSKDTLLDMDMLFDCFQMKPTTWTGQGWAGQTEEAFINVGLDASDHDLGKEIMSILNRPNVKTDFYKKNHPFLSQILPYLESHIVDARF
ncbi:hypothetical protein [Acetobacter tropicalis]|nr:hypothetical protein [Acetobacter tropicalis]